MENPITRMLRKNNTNNMPQIMNILGAKNPDELFDNMINTNPRFKRFVEENKGRTPEEIAKAYGLDPSVLNKF